MSTRFISDEELWPKIARLSKQRGRRAAAIAFLGADAPALLDSWAMGDKVVCNAGPSALRSGATSPDALAELLKRGVRVVSNANLHAKVIVAGGHAVVGSMNASQSSSGRLSEAALLTDEVAQISAARQYIDGLIVQGTTVDKQFIKVARDAFRQSTGWPPGGRPKPRPRGGRLHLVPIWEPATPASVQAVFEEHESSLETQLRPRSRYALGYSWDPDAWCRPGEWTLWIQQSDPESTVLAPQECRAVIPVGGRSRQRVFFWAEDQRASAKPWRAVAAALAAHGQSRRPDVSSVVTGASAIEAVFSIWKMQVPDVYDLTRTGSVV